MSTLIKYKRFLITITSFIIAMLSLAFPFFTFKNNVVVSGSDFITSGFKYVQVLNFAWLGLLLFVVGCVLYINKIKAKRMAEICLCCALSPLIFSAPSLNGNIPIQSFGTGFCFLLTAIVILSVAIFWDASQYSAPSSKKLLKASKQTKNGVIQLLFVLKNISAYNNYLNQKAIFDERDFKFREKGFKSIQLLIQDIGEEHFPPAILQILQSWKIVTDSKGYYYCQIKNWFDKAA